MRRRGIHVSVWMNEAEHKHLKTQAQIAGMGIDPFLRSLVAGAHLRPRPPEEYAALLRQLSGITTNVNQIAHRVNIRQYATKSDLAELDVLVREAHQLVKDAL